MSASVFVRNNGMGWFVRHKTVGWPRHRAVPGKDQVIPWKGSAVLSLAAFLMERVRAGLETMTDGLDRLATAADDATTALEASGLKDPTALVDA